MRVSENDQTGENRQALTNESRRGRKADLGPRPILALLLVAPLLAQGAQAGPTDGPLPPLALTADSTGGDVVLSWHAPLGDVDGYRVYRADDAEAVALHGLDAFAAIGETQAPTYVVGAAGSSAESSDANPSDAIYFVTAFLDDQESPPSNPMRAQYPACWDFLRPTDCFIP